MDEKKKFIVTDIYDYLDKIVAIDWNKFPESLVDSLPGKYLYNVLSLTTEGQIEEKTVIYIKPVRKFKKGIKEFEINDIIIGI